MRKKRAQTPDKAAQQSDKENLSTEKVRKPVDNLPTTTPSP
jgi:hypothetical protein